MYVCMYVYIYKYIYIYYICVHVYNTCMFIHIGSDIAYYIHKCKYTQVYIYRERETERDRERERDVYLNTMYVRINQQMYTTYQPAALPIIHSLLYASMRCFHI